MTYQQPPSQPGQQPPNPYGMYAPPPPKKMSTGAKVGIGCGGAFGALVLLGVIGAAIGGGDSGTRAEKPAKAAAAPAPERAKGKAAPADAKPEKKPEKPEGKPDAPKKAEPAPKSPADRFKAFVAKHGSPNEKAAPEHVTKVQGADELNDILDSVDIHTDFTGGLMGPHQSEGKLIASAFADWKESKNGLVTVYDVKGEILSNGNF
ncbi:hypothetical protein TPA0598_09_02360 [Streptomyces lydicamycinicus]|uniref:Uncharacterized protein n=1 Tax=Streptomyces lydicamycinicus TaxID=1546107 RepID=A0A0P4RFD4_9ACTN|nr:hypothetical protein [Streptomyces lydicamycinicus]GAO11945.1 hypothetical protein TPA0598_09_02360 [Streptomyces lydicamycinicus]